MSQSIVAPILAAIALASKPAPAVLAMVVPVLAIGMDLDFLEKIKKGYAKGIGIAGVSKQNSLLYVADCLIVPRVADVWNICFRWPTTVLVILGLQNLMLLCENPSIGRTCATISKNHTSWGVLTVNATSL